MKVDDLKNELEFTRYADKLLTKINGHSEAIYGKSLTGPERVELAIGLIKIRAGVVDAPVKKGRK